MSIIVELPDLPAVRRHFGPALLLTTDRGAIKAVHTAPEQAEDGALLLRAPGRGSVRNVEANDRVTLVWHPPSEPGFSLIVDGVAGVVEGSGERPDLLVVPTGAVLHRPVTTSRDAATHPFWISAFLDVAPAHWDGATAFWPAVTGTRLDDLRGASDEYATLRPPAGHAHLKLQRLDDGASRTHIDLHVPEPGRAADVAESLGATVLERSPDGFVVLRSPAGVLFCLVAHAACLPAPSVLHDDGRTTRADHLCIDVAADHDFDDEVRFWTRLTGRRIAPIESAEFRELTAPAGQPLTLLLQRLETPGGSGAHVDLSSSDRAAEVAAHRALGAELVEERPDWTVLRAPDGRLYCVAAHAADAPL